MKVASKEEYEKSYLRNKKLQKIFFIISMALFALTIALVIIVIVMTINDVDVVLIPELISSEITFTLRNLLTDFISTALAAAIVLLVFSACVFRRRANFAKAVSNNYDEFAKQMNRFEQTYSPNPSTVDVKPVEEEKPNPEASNKDEPTGKYASIIMEYKKLYEQGFISEEEYIAKKKELENL